MRQTILYLPAQIVGPLAQMAAMIVWTYYLAPEALGAYAIVWAIQELAGLTALFWWSAYVLRYVAGLRAPEERNRLDAMESAVQIGAALVQAAFAAAAVRFVVDIEPSVHFIAATLAFTLTRNLASHFADRARAHAEIAAFSVNQIAGSLLGLGLGLAAFAVFPATPETLLWAYAAAQAAALAAALPLMRWRLRAPAIDRALLAGAWRYGAPLVVASLLFWIGSQSIRFIVQYEEGVAAVGYVTVGWWLGLRLTTFAALLVSGASFTVAVRRIAEVGHRAALPQFAMNGALLLAVLVPSVAGVILLGGSMVEALVAAPYRAMTCMVLPLAVAAGALRVFKNHGSDQCFLLFERTTLNVWSTVLEALATVAGCWIGLKLGGVHGAALGCLVAACVAGAASFAVANRLFGYYLDGRDLARIAGATAAMSAVLALLPPAHSLGGLLVEIAVGAAVYGAAMAALYPDPVRRIAGRAGLLLARR